MKKILVADDDELVRAMIKRALEKKGFLVIESDDGDKALELVSRDYDIELIVLDLKMQRMNGKEAYTEIRKVNPDLKCIVSSAYIGEAEEKELAALGIKAFLKKPYHIGDLYATVDRMVENHN